MVKENYLEAIFLVLLREQNGSFDLILKDLCENERIFLVSVGFFLTARFELIGTLITSLRKTNQHPPSVVDEITSRY